MTISKDIRDRVTGLVVVVAVLVALGVIWVDDARNLWDFMGFMGWLIAGSLAWILFTGVCTKSMWKHEKSTVLLLGLFAIYYWTLVIRTLVLMVQ